MSKTPHIVIIGAGLIGVSSADALLRRGARVTLVERDAAVMHGASFANSGMIHPSQACSWSGDANTAAADAAVRDLALRSVDIMQDRMQTLGLDMMAARPPGCWQLFDTATDADAAYDRMRARGITVERRGPTPTRYNRPALFFPADRSGDARRYGEALAQSCLAAGGEIRLSADDPVLGLDKTGRPELRIGQDIIKPDAIVVACGAQSADVLAAVNIKLPVSPVRGWAVDYDKPDSVRVPDVPIMDAASRSALTVFGDVLRLSGTMGEASESPLLARWQVIAPELMDALNKPRRVWSGLRPVSAKGRPFIGESSVPGLWVNAGHGHMGWTLCAGSGELLAEMMTEGAVDSRFAL